MKFAPAGYEDEYDDEYDDWDDYGENMGEKVKFTATKSPIELKKARLIELVRAGNLIEIREELDHGLPKGLDIDEKLDGRWNLLFYSCHFGAADLVEFLIEERGASITVEEDTETPLMVACSSQENSENLLRIAKLLVHVGCNFRMADCYGVTPLMRAANRGHLEVVKFLLARDSMDAIDNEGQNALFHAIGGKKFEVAKLLIDKGINLNIRSSLKLSAREYAIDENQLDIVGLFPPVEEKILLPGFFTNYSRFEDLIPQSGSDL